MKVITLLTCHSFYLIHANIIHSINNQMSSNFSSISNVCVEIITHCYAKSIQNIVLYGDTNNDVLKLLNQLNKPVSISVQNERISYVQFEKNSALFIIVISSLNTLHDNLKTLKTIPYWNINQPFFIMHNATSENCDDVFIFLRKSWSYNLLHVFFLCYQSGSVLIWTFNPFMINAPDSWHHYKTVSDNLSMQWTLYYQTYTNDSYRNICENLHWDKAAKLNEFKIKVVGFPLFPSGISDEYNVEECHSNYRLTILNVMFTHMNLSVLLYCIPTNKVGMIQTSGESTGIFKDIANGKYDILLNVFFGQYAENIRMTQRNLIGTIKFVVLPKQNITTVEKIVRYLGYKLILVTIIILLITAVILRCYIKQSFSSLFLEILRILTATAIRKLPKTLALRYFFGPVFLFFLLFQELFQGNLSTLLSISIPKKNLETIHDLKSHINYKIYVSKAISSLVDKELQERLIIVPEINCMKYVLNDTKAACIAPQYMLLNSQRVYELHFSTESFYTGSYFLLTRNDWPIQKKFQESLLKMIQSGHMYVSDKKYMNTKIKVSDQLSDIMGNTNFAPLRLNDLMFIFKILITGLCIAIIVFFVEIKKPKK